MTVNTTSITSGPYTGNGVTTSFPYTFKAFTDANVIVYQTVGTSQSTLTLGTHYSVTGTGIDGGGNVVMVTAPASGDEIYIRSNYSAEQLTDFDSQGGFYPDTHEDAFDKQTMLIQQLEDIQGRGLRLPLSDSNGVMPELTPSPLALLRWNADGDAVENASIETINPNAFDTSLITQKINTWADISIVTPTNAGQLFTLAQHTSGGLGGGTLMAVVGSVTDDGGTQKNCLGGFHLKRINYDTVTPQMFGYTTFFTMSNAQLDLYLNAGGLITGEKSDGIGYILTSQLMANSRDVYMLVQGDSTGNATDEWVYLVSQWLASEYPAYTVNYRLWNATSYYTPSVIATGSGSHTLYIYNASIPGASNQYFAASNAAACYDGKTFDLIIQNFGHNGGTDGTVESVTRALSGSVADLIQRNPSSEVVLTLQNIDTSFPAFSARQVDATKKVASMYGLGVIDVRSIYQSKSNLSTMGDWLADVVHPNATGSIVWTECVKNALRKCESKVVRLNPLASKTVCLVDSPFFQDWIWNASVPNGWVVTNCTAAKEMTIKETLSYSLKLTGTSGSLGTAQRNISDILLSRPTGERLTFVARIYKSSANVGINSGRIEIASSVGSVASDVFVESFDGWSWVIVTAPASLLDTATWLKLFIYAGTTGDICYVDRFCVLDGDMPAESLLLSGALADYYDPSNVGVIGSNVVTVTNDTIVMDSTSEAFPSFYINIFGLSANKQYTATWDYVGGGTGTVLARDGLNDSGTVMATATPLSLETLTFRARNTSACLQVSNSAGTTPFTLNLISVKDA